MLFVLIAVGVLLVRSLGRTSVDQLIEIPQIYYAEPSYPIEGFNLTIGMVANVAGPKGFPFPAGIAAYLGATCTVAAINTNQTNLRLRGSMNLLAINSAGEFQNSYYEYMQLLQLNLASNNTTVAQAVKVPYPPPLGAVLGAGNFYQVFSAIPFFEGFRIPVISFGPPSQFQQPGSTKTVLLNAVSFSKFSVNPYVAPDLTVALSAFLGKMKFTFVAPVFQEGGIFGFEGIFALQAAGSIANGAVSAVCGRLLNPLSKDAEERAKKFVDCVKTYNKIEFIILWTSSFSGIALMKQIVDAGGKDFRFIIVAKNPAETGTPEGVWPYLEGSFFMSEAYQPVTREDIQQCVATLGRDPFEGLVDLERYFKFEAACDRYANTGLPYCKKLESGRYSDAPCVCDYYDFLVAEENDFRYSLAADSITTYAEALHLLQNNCSYLNDFYPLQGVLGRPVDYCAITEFTPEILSTAIAAVKFMAQSGEISFVRNTFLRKRANFNFYQWGKNGTYKKVGFYSNFRLELDFSAISYPNGKAPVSRVVASVPTLSDAYVDVFFGLIIAILVADFALMVWLVMNWSEKPVRRSSPVFLLLITIGVALVLVAGIIMSIGLDSSTMCALYVFFLLIGFTLILACLLAKNWRIYQIFSNKSPNPILINDRALILIPAGLLLLTIGFCFVYVFAGGMIEAVEKTGTDNDYYVYIICLSPTDWFQIFCIILFYCYLMVLVVGMAVLGYMTRSIHVHYNESKNLAIIVYIYMCMAVIFIPLYYVQGSSTSSQSIRYTIVSISMCILMPVTLAILFTPLILRVKREKKVQPRPRSLVVQN